MRRYVPDDFDAGAETEPFDSLGHDWQDAGDLGRDEWEHITGLAECVLCGKLSSDPRGVTEPCPA